jgi:TolA-binding protein
MLSNICGIYIIVMKTIDFNYFIERYISGEMEPAERTWFEKEIKGNPSILSEIELRRRTNDILKQEDILDLRKKLSVIAKDHSRKASVINLSNKMTRYAAVLVAIIGVGTLIYLPAHNLGNDELFSKYYEPAPTATESVTRSAGAGIEESYMQAIEYYNTGNYNCAINQFIKYTSTTSNNPEAYMMLGNSYAGISEFTEAGINFKKVVDHNDNLYIEDANWLLGLCYLKTGETEKARTQMELISQSDSRHNRQAKKVLRKMK